MQTQFDLGDSVRVVRNVRNDGTYPGAAMGDLLVRLGSVGTVVDIGTFLMDQIIYTVHFLDDDKMVGCREEEVIGADDPWVPSLFESREKVRAGKLLKLSEDAQIPIGAIGEVLKVLRDEASATVLYHMHFDCLPGRTLAVPESALSPLRDDRAD